MDQNIEPELGAAEAHTLIGPYALDALDDGERADFERHLAECATCRDEVAGLRRTVVRLADAVAERRRPGSGSGCSRRSPSPPRSVTS